MPAIVESSASRCFSTNWMNCILRCKTAKSHAATCLMLSQCSVGSDSLSRPGCISSLALRKCSIGSLMPSGMSWKELFQRGCRPAETSDCLQEGALVLWQTNGGVGTTEVRWLWKSMTLVTALVRGALGPEKTSVKDQRLVGGPCLSSQARMPLAMASQKPAGYSEEPFVPNDLTTPQLMSCSQAACARLVRSHRCADLQSKPTRSTNSGMLVITTWYLRRSQGWNMQWWWKTQ